MKGDQIGFAPDDVPKGKTVGIVLWPEESATGDLKAWFTKKAPAMGATGGQFRESGGVVLTGGVRNARPFILAAVRPAGSTTRARVAMLFGDADQLKRHQDSFSDLLRDIRGGRAATSDSGGERPKASGAKTSADQKKWANLPVVSPSAPLPPASLGGAKVFIIYTNTYGLSGMEVRTEPLILFPNGTAFDGAPDGPVAAFDAAHLKPTYRPTDIGRWTIVGTRMTLKWPARKRDATVVYRKVGEGWTSEADTKADDAWNIYRRVVPVTQAKIQGAWKTESLVTMGTMGGAAPMVAAGSSGDLAFKGNRYSDSMSRFASSTTANMGDAFKSGGDVGAYSKGGDSGSGRYRIDGLLLTRERYGKRGVELAFLMPHWDGDKMGSMMIGSRRYDRPKK